MQEREFHTFQEYLRNDQELLTPSAEDYMEMIYRLTKEKGYTRVNDLAAALNVSPPSVTKMIKKLTEMNFIKYEKYGIIIFEEAGEVIGRALLKRHNLIERFLKFLDVTEGLLEETEKIEHTINEEILCGMNDLVDFFQGNIEIYQLFLRFREEHTRIHNQETENETEIEKERVKETEIETEKETGEVKET